MRSWMFGAVALAILPAGCETDGSSDLGAVLGDVLGQTGGILGTQGSGSQQALTTLEIDAALRQALEIGAGRVADQIGVTDGYWKDPNIQIPLPGTLGELQDTFSGTPLASPFDDLQLRMNRAAEDAVPAGKQIVVDAVKSITIEDALSLLNGGDTAATDFLRRKSEDQLRSTFTPYVQQALDSSGAYRALDSVTSNNAVLAGYTGQWKSDLTTHAVQFGLDGLFDYLALEEKKIRENPLARTTDLLRKVFGAR